MRKKPATADRRLVLEARRRAQEAEEHGPRTVSEAEVRKVGTISARRARMLTTDEIEQLRQEMKRDAAWLRAEFAKKKRPA